MATYDTGEIRRAARTVQRSRDRLNTAVLRNLRKVESELDGEFQGQAADALATRLAGMDADIRRMDEKLDTLYRTLMKFAQRMDEIDQELSSKM